MYIALFWIFFAINVGGIGAYFIYFHGCLKKMFTRKTTICKQINIKNRTYYFYNDIIDIKNFDSTLLKIDKKSYKNIGIYNIGYITIKNIGDCKIIYSVNPLYLRVNHANRYIEEKGVNKYLIFDSTDENKELLKKICKDGLREKIKEVSSGECDYEKDYMKIKFNSDDNLPLNKPLKFHNMTVITRSNFEEDVNFIRKFFCMILCPN